jgi:hypothetical protein
LNGNWPAFVFFLLLMWKIRSLSTETTISSFQGSFSQWRRPKKSLKQPR